MNLAFQASVSESRAMKNPMLSCVIPAYNEAENIMLLVPTLYETLKTLSDSIEIIVVDDGSQDLTAAAVIKLSDVYPIKLIQLSRNFGKENAITAGLDHVGGDVILIIDADGQHPLSLLPDLFNHWKSGYDMVYGIRTHRKHESFLKRKLTACFYSLFNYDTSVKITPDAGDFRLFDKKVLSAIKALPERARFMKGLYAWVGFKSIAVPFEPLERHQGTSHYNFRRLAELALTGLTSFTDLPLRISGIVGATISACAMLYGVYIALKTCLFGAELPGWATLTVAITFLGGLQLFSIGVLGEYIGRIFTEVKGRPTYIVARQFGFENDPKS